jgi:CheY-like chemotaxis protein
VVARFWALLPLLNLDPRGLPAGAAILERQDLDHTLAAGVHSTGGKHPVAIPALTLPLLVKPRVLRIIVVEDEAINALLLAEVLEDLGHDVCAVEATQAGAVTAALRCKPDLMIVDATLGEGSGVAAIEEIQRTRPVPHVFVSGDIRRVRGVRPDAVLLQKPFRIAELERAIERALAVASASI